MREIFDWKIVYEALSGIPLQFGVEVRDSVVICLMEVQGNQASLGGSVRIDAGVMAEPEVIREILRSRVKLGVNAAMIAVIRPENGRGIDDFFAELRRDWPLEYHAGYALHTDEAIAASCACGDEIQIGDALELCATTTATQWAGRDVWADETWFRAKRTPGGAMATKMAGLIAEQAAVLDSAEVTALAVEMLTRREFSMAQKARVVGALQDLAFRDGFLSWATSTRDSPRDFARFFSRYEVPDQRRIDRAISLLRSLCRWLPEGVAAAPLASAAYLAWFSGNGIQARVLTEQATEEDSEYSLTALMNKILDAGAPPPWVTQRAEQLVS